MLDREAWEAPATPEQIADAVSTVAALVEPDASPERIAVLTRFIGDEDYTAAEMRLIARMGPKANHYGKHVRVDVLHEIVTEHRKVRAMLDRMVTGEEIAALCTAHPEISPDDFAPGTFDRFNNRLYRYAPEIARRARERGLSGGPVIEDDAPRRIGDAPPRDERLRKLVAGIAGDEAPEHVRVEPPKARRDARDYPSAPAEDDPVTGRSAGEDYHAAPPVPPAAEGGASS